MTARSRLIARCTLTLATLLLPAAGLAAEPGAIQVGLRPGQAHALCASGSSSCASIAPRCDDLAVATLRDTRNGPAIVAVAPGKTRCSARTANMFLQVFEVTVAK